MLNPIVAWLVSVSISKVVLFFDDIILSFLKLVDIINLFDLKSMLEVFVIAAWFGLPFIAIFNYVHECSL
jgi:hypothetical protein